MATSTYHKHFLDLPNETILNVLSCLDKPDLAEVRHVCKRLSHFGAKLLFNSITTSVVHLRSLLRLACHPELSNYVEELIFLEMELSYTREDVTWPLLEQTECIWEVVNLVRKHFGLYPDFDENTTVGDEDWDPSTYEMNEPYHYSIDGPQPQMFSDMFLDPWKPNTAARAMFLLLVDTIEHYKQLQKFSKSEEAYRMLKTSLGGLSNLKRIKICDAQQGGILQPSSYLPPSLVELQQYFPIDEAVIRTRFAQRGPGYVSAVALPNILAALAESEKSIDSLIVFPNTGLFQTGTRMDQADSLEYHLQTDQGHYKHGLSYVRSLEMTLDIYPGVSHEAEPNEIKAQTSLISQCLRLSTTNIENLSISFVHDVAEHQGEGNKGFFHVIPLDSVFTKLHSLALGQFVFESEPALTNFLIKQPALRNLSLFSCEVIGTWCGVIDLLKAARSFVLDTINLQHPRDTENHEQEDADGMPTMSYLSSIVSNNRILDYINLKGTSIRSNPFAKSQRRWRDEDAVAYRASTVGNAATHDASSELDDDVEDIEYENASDWDYEEHVHCVPEWRARHAEDADEEGPEYDTDYDFDAEAESDSDDEGVIWGKDEWLPKSRKLVCKRSREEVDDTGISDDDTRILISVRNEPGQRYDMKPEYKVLLISTDFGDALELFHTSHSPASEVLGQFHGNCGTVDVNCRRGTGTFTIAVIDGQGKKTQYKISAEKKLTIFALNPHDKTHDFIRTIEESIRRNLNPGRTTDVITLGLPTASSTRNDIVFPLVRYHERQARQELEVELSRPNKDFSKESIREGKRQVFDPFVKEDGSSLRNHDGGDTTPMLFEHDKSNVDDADHNVGDNTPEASNICDSE